MSIDVTGGADDFDDDARKDSFVKTVEKERAENHPLNEFVWGDRRRGKYLCLYYFCPMSSTPGLL